MAASHPAPQATTPVQLPAAVPDLLPVATSVTGGTDRQRELVASALERYGSAGLDVPALQIHLPVDPEVCGGNRGLFSPSSTPWTITVCTDHPTVFLHEIGHAWSEFNLSDEQRSDYVERRGLESWNDPQTAWNARGSEDAAKVLAWGLVDDPISEMMAGGPLARMNDAFRVLTGNDSPRITP